MLWVFLGPCDELVITLWRIGNECRIVGKCGLAVEHRHDVAVDIRTERHFRIIARHQLTAVDFAAIIFEELRRHHRSDELLVDDSDVGVPFFHASLGLGFETLENLLRACIARTCSHNANGRSGIFLLEQRSEILIDIVNHVLVTCRDDGKLIGGGGCNGEANCHCRVQDSSHEKDSCMKPGFPVF